MNIPYSAFRNKLLATNRLSVQNNITQLKEVKLASLESINSGRLGGKKLRMESNNKRIAPR